MKYECEKVDEELELLRRIDATRRKTEEDEEIEEWIAKQRRFADDVDFYEYLTR